MVRRSSPGFHVKSVTLVLLYGILCAQSAMGAPSQASGSISLGGRALHYLVEAGYTVLRSNPSAKPDAKIFTTTYLINDSDEHRPVAFLWNGGPGASSSVIQFLGFGPKLLNGTTLVDNPDTLLPEMDLVFIDAVGTGYSRLLSAQSSKFYYSTVGDAKATEQFIRAWLRSHDASNRPVFLIGESFGGYRAGGVTERLESDGQTVTGVILISGGVASGPLIPKNVRAALVTPQRAASALVLGKIPGNPDRDRGTVVRAATQWALNTYLPALTYLADLNSRRRNEIARQLSGFTGYPANQIDKSTLIIPTRAYLRALSPVPGKPLSQYDMRTTTEVFVNDHALDSYYRALGVRNVPAFWDEDVSNPLQSKEKSWIWNYRWPESAKWGSDYAEPWLPAAMKVNPGLRVLVAAGQYDSANSCAENDVLAAMLEPDLAKQYTFRCYLGGHILYSDPRIRAELSRDIQSFIRDTLSGRHREVR